MDIYAQNIMDHYKNPRNAGDLIDPTIYHEEANLSCGDKIGVGLILKNDCVCDVKFKGSGCAISQSAMSILSEWIMGRSIKDIRSLDKETFFLMLGVPISFRRTKCALLGLLSVKNGLFELNKEKKIEWFDLVGDDG